jgi:hypothetical protein
VFTLPYQLNKADLLTPMKESHPMINFDCLVLKIFLLSSTIMKLERFLSTEKRMRQSKIEKALRVPEVKEYNTPQKLGA